MTEITRVPLQPIQKGSVTKVWLGIVVALLVGLGLAWLGHAGSVRVETLVAGTGPKPTVDDVVLVNYVGRLANGKEFDRGERVPFPVTGVVPGLTQALVQMQKGGKYRVEIPAAKAYGAHEQRNPQTGEVVIPANSDLVFEIELIDFRNRAEVEAQQRMLEQMQQQMAAQQGAGAGAAGGAGVGAAPGGVVPVQPGAPQP